MVSIWVVFFLFENIELNGRLGQTLSFEKDLVVAEDIFGIFDARFFVFFMFYFFLDEIVFDTFGPKKLPGI